MDVFDALADPTRRRLLELLAERERSVGELTRAFPDLTQPAVSRHLRVLREGRLVRSRSRGTSRLYSLAPDGFADVQGWVTQVSRFWTGKLDALEAHLTAPVAQESGDSKEDI